MELVLRPDGELHLQSPEDFSRFSLRLDGADPVAHAAIEPAEEDGHVWIARSAVVAAAGGAATPDWLASFERMVEKAARFGWVSPDGQKIRAHIRAD